MARATHSAHTIQAIYRVAEQKDTAIKERPVRKLVDTASPTSTQEAAVHQASDQNFFYNDLHGENHQAAGN